MPLANPAPAEIAPTAIRQLEAELEQLLDAEEDARADSDDEKVAALEVQQAIVRDRLDVLDPRCMGAS